mmetsp:Transcript_68083/g.195415  ORF Transcript_68083/g.195415 Transcript_68083/m.195415 type:complete len:295 (-) Transcript_68083:47-931(-)
MLRGMLRITFRCVEFVTCCPTSACLVEKRTHCLEDGTLLFVELGKVWCHGVLQVLARRHQSDCAPCEDAHLPEGLHVGEEAEVQPILRIEASDGFMVRLEGFDLLNKHVFCHVAHPQQFCEKTLDAAGPGVGEQSHAGDAEDFCCKRSVTIHHGGVQHRARIDRAHPPDGAWQHELNRECPQFENTGHEAVVLQAIFPFQRLSGPENIALASVIELGHLLHLGVEHRARVLGRLPHLLAAEVVHFMPQGNQGAGHGQGGVDVPGSHGEDEGEATRSGGHCHFFKVGNGVCVGGV